MNNIDPYNNIPPSRPHGGMGAPGMPPPGMGSPGMPPPGWERGAPQEGMSSQRPPQRMSLQAENLAMENSMLKSDLDVAIAYIRQLGGQWPPPHR